MNDVELYRAYTPAPLYSDLGKGLIKVYFNEQSKEVDVSLMDEKSGTKQAVEYTAWHVDVLPDYSHIISSIVRSKYSQDDVEAILCNHVEGRVENEYDDLVTWRAMARTTAQKVMGALGKVV